MKNRFIYLIIFIFFVYPICQAQEKMPAALAPMGTLGNISKTEKQIIFNSLQESLSTYYLLASQKSFEKAQDQAFEELDYEECTEDQCFALIQQILQVDNLFLFNLTREGSFTQLSLTRVDLDSQRLVRTVLCKDCDIGTLNTKVDELVLKIFKEDTNTDGLSFFNEKESESSFQQPPILTEPVEQLSPSGFGMGWKLGAMALTLGSGLSSLNQAKTYNDLASKNKSLREQYSSANTVEERNILESEYLKNQKQMNATKSTIRTLDGVTLAGLLALAYMYASEDDDPVKVVSENNFIKPRNSGLQFSLLENHMHLGWQWNF